MKELLEIYISFFKMGAVTFGGGYAMLPILQREVVEKKQWLENEKIMDYYAIAQGLPGIIAVNVSVFIGYARKKLLGGVAAALGVVSPCIVIISIIAACLSNFQDNVYVQHAFAGISVCVCALILNSVLDLAKKGVKDAVGIVLCVVTFLLMEFTSVSPVLIIVSAALIGIAAKKIMLRKGTKESEVQSK